jgi:hypothetical protein
MGITAVMNCADRRKRLAFSCRDPFYKTPGWIGERSLSEIEP